jgi:hypothetical protein
MISLKQEDGIKEGDIEIQDYTTYFYKNQFGPYDSVGNISLNVYMPCVLDDADRDYFGREFTVDEIKLAVFQIKKNKPPESNGSPIEFYQSFWPMICNDLFALRLVW